MGFADFIQNRIAGRVVMGIDQEAIQGYCTIVVIVLMILFMVSRVGNHFW